MKILLTGITGTIGVRLTKRLLDLNYEVVGLSRDEFKQSKFPFKSHVQLRLGDIRDEYTVIKAARNCDAIIHTAALKHVDLMEANPLESLKTNILGTTNILNSQLINNVHRVLMLSTDKAVYPINVYGQSKAISERLVLEQSDENQIVRYGNVLNSRGSVIDLFKKQLLLEGRCKITCDKMTRFWIKQDDAVNLIIDTLHNPNGGKFVPKMKGASVVDIANAVLSQLNGFESQAPYKVVGMRLGEKTHECLRSKYETIFGESEAKDVYSNEVEQFTFQELLKMTEGEL